ncbi:MAG: SH3 domain-containing protein [Janthinobacterium lividum]
MSKLLILYISSILFFHNIVLAENKKLPIPRFASIKSNEVNARTGPSTKCPLEWIFVKKDEPVEIVAEYEQWRQIKDIEGQGGWVHSSVLSGKRSVIIKDKNIIELLRYPTSNKNEVVARVSPSVRCQLKKCTQEFCLLLCKGNKGWARRTVLWGIYINEQL